jgi:alpha-glucosidase
VTEARPGQLADAHLDGASAVVTLEGSGASATLRFTPGDGEVTVALHAAASALTPRSLALHFACDAAARFLGFGEQYEKIDHRGEAFPLFTSEQGIGRDPSHPSPLSGNPWTTYFPVPFFLDPRGYGVAVDTSARVAVDLCKSDPASYSFTIDDPGDVVLHVYTGPTVAEVMRAWTLRQGRSAAAPRWSVDGAWIGVQGGPDSVRSAVQKAKAAGAAVSTVWVQDWIGEIDLGGGLQDITYHWTADTTLYPDLAGLIAELRAEGIHFLGYFNPFIVEKFGNDYAQGTASGYTIQHADGTPYVFLISVFSGTMLDVTNPDAVAWFQGYAKSALALGMDGWMDDFGEWLPYDAKLHAGDARLEHNLYPTKWHQASRDVLGPDQLIFSRSGWLGEAKTSQIVWAGDQQADWDPWDGLPTVTPALVSLGLAGISWVTHDVAGFTGGPSTKELYLRWMELAAFTPIFRTHEGLDRGNNWFWYSDAETLAAFSRWTRVHAALADTFWQLDAEHMQSGMPIVRALALGYPDDDRAVVVSDEFTIGTDLLVAPVTAPGATSRMVYFPKGHWIDAWDPSRSVDGPMEIAVDAPVGRPPVFSQSGRTDLAAIQ